MQCVIEAATDGLPAPDQHRIMNSLCNVDPFRRTPAWPPARKVRLRLSPHFPGFRPPFGLKQNGVLFPRQQATGAGLMGGVNALGDANVRSPCPGRQSRPPCGKADLPSPAGACKCSSPSGLRNRPCSFYNRGTPVPGSPGPWASSFRWPRRRYGTARPSSASSPRPTLPP